MVGDVAHVDKEVRHVRATRPWLTGGAELGRGVLKLISVLKSSPVQSFCPNLRQLATELVATSLSKDQSKTAERPVATGF